MEKTATACNHSIKSRQRKYGRAAFFTPHRLHSLRDDLLNNSGVSRINWRPPPLVTLDNGGNLGILRDPRIINHSKTPFKKERTIRMPKIMLERCTPTISNNIKNERMTTINVVQTQGASASATKPRSIRKEKGKGIATELEQPKSRKRQRAVYESNIVEKGGHL
ncbi:unnamed protein product [Ilex paraguariensis]|uniref:Uncharacterized protein n=1 Tax=Ilex paraguariensis TaxID=185542 RepID=A0ABC8TEE6_9AQUA